MSLLMDALKKAEQEKKEAAKRLKEAQAQAGEEMGLADKGQEHLAQPSKDVSPVAKTEHTSNVEVPDRLHTTLSLEAIEPDDKTDESKIQDVKEQDLAIDEDVDDITLENQNIFVRELSIAKDDEEIVNLAGSKPEPEQDLDQTFVNMDIGDQDTPPPSPKVALSFEDTVQSEEANEFYDTISESKPVTSVISAAELVKVIGGGKDQPTPVAAQTVFTAIGTGREMERVKWVIFLVLCLVVAVSLSVIYYFKIVPINIDSSSPLVAKGIETDPTTLPPVEIPEEILQGVVIGDTGNEELPAGAETGGSHTPGDTAAVEDINTEYENLTEQSDAVVAMQEPESDTVLSNVVPEDVAKLLPPKSGIETRLADEHQGLPENIEVDPAIIKITRSKSRAENDEVINSAYLAYKNGNYRVAEDNYRKVLANSPENKDALLGIAAIQYIKGNFQEAYSLYYNVLKLYPHDNLARSSLISMHNGKNTEQSESAIKLMLQQEPESAFLYFTLGNIYASQSRWPDAQQAFFDAYRFESSNPDYAFNLAVSLDRIGQVNTALDYYNVALQLADTGTVNFNTATVLARINTLSSIKDQNK